jgi:Uma2 family endonuclease
VSAVPKTHVTPSEYLARERAAEYKSEYCRGEIFPMPGASKAHNRIKDNLVCEIGQRFKKTEYRTMSSDMRVKIPDADAYTYPDIVIYREPGQLEDEHFDTMLDPIVLLEILSDSTEDYDRGEKFHQYQQIATLREYVLVAQDRMHIERYLRHGDAWARTDFTGPHATLTLHSVPVQVPLAEIYDRVPLPPTVTQ